MHDIDRTQLEAQELESGMQEHSEEVAGEGIGMGEGPLAEAHEIELASELLSVSNEQELEQFLGNLMSTMGGAVGRFARSDTGQALGGVLKDAARQALPIVGGAVGQWIRPDGGRAIGADIGTQAGRLFGLELEGLSSEDKEFEVARQFVRFAATAARRALRSAAAVPALTAATNAAAAAARLYAPGLLPRLQGRSSLMWPRSGRWMRRGRTIVLYGG